ncbi:MAG: T9SS type A sorting domain-containing protein [Cyclobacteriaceae bacterium]
MKKILSLLVLVIAINSVQANGIEPKSLVGMSVVKSGTIFKLFYRGEKSGKVKVSIFDAKGKMVWNETLRNTENFMRPYNFSSLPAGDYTIEISDEQGKHVERIIHSFATKRTLVRLTTVSAKDHKYLLSVPNHGPGALTVKIYNDAETLIYHKVESVKGDFGKIYNLSRVKGACTFEITDKTGKSNNLIANK